MDSLASMLSMLRSGSLLDREHVNRMKSAIASDESAIADLDSKILALEAQRDALAKSLSIRRALMAPVRRLPCEILADIFEHCLPTDTSATECVTNCFGDLDVIIKSPLRADNNTDAPFLLLRICHKWRNIAEQTARLWTNVSICCEQSIPYASFRLQKSRSAPLDAFIFNMEDGGCCCPRGTWRSRPALRGLQDNEQSQDLVKKHPEFYQALFSKLPLANRLEYCGSFGVLSRLPAADMDSLKEITLMLIRTNEIPGENFPILKATHLRTLALYESAHLMAYVAPTNHLRRLTLICTQTDRLLIDPLCDFLRSCPGIEEFIFLGGRMCTTIHRENGSQNPIHLRALSNIQLQIHNIADPEWIGLLHAPNLRAATILYEHKDLRLLHQFLSIARESLEHLIFQFFNLSSPQLHGLLSTLSEVDTLGFTHCDEHGALWEYLTPGEGVPPECWICPKLQHLGVRFEDPRRLQVEDPRFVEFIRRRSDDRAECLSPQHDGSCYLTDINLQGDPDLFISQSAVTALSALQVERKGLTIRGLPKNYVN